MVWTRLENGQLQNSSSGNTWGTERGYKRKPSRKRKNWVDVIKRDFKNIDFTWEEAEVLANDKAEWRRLEAHAAIQMRDELR